jgi:hypothetical protein
MMIRKFTVLVAVICIATAAWAGAKDKLKGALVNTTSCRGVTGWDNEAVKATYSADAKQMQIAWKGTTPALDGQKVYCFLSGDMWLGDTGPLGNCLVMVGSAVGGQMKMKGKVASVSGGMAPDQIQFNSGLECYLDPGNTTAYDGVTPSTPGCAGLWIQQDVVNFNDDNIIGVCQGGSPGNPCTVFPDAAPLAVSGLGAFPKEPLGGLCP